MGNGDKIPTHVAIIMDGNGRWAQQQGKERYEGHIEGVASVRACIKAALRNGVRYLTLYTFSTENWGRPQEEVDALMQLFCQSVTNETPELIKEGVRVRFIGRRDRFSEVLKAAKSAISARKHVVFTILSMEVPAAVKTALRFSITCVV